MHTEEKKKVRCQYNQYANLTIGKEYEVVSKEENKIVVVDDNNKKTPYYKSRFSKEIN